MNANDVLIDGQDISKANLRTLLASYEEVDASQTAQIAGLQVAMSAAQALANAAATSLASVVSLAGSSDTRIGALEAARSAEASQLVTVTTSLGAQAVSIASLQAAVAAAEAAFVSLSSIITNAGNAGEGPILPVSYPGLNLTAASFATDSPFGGAHKSLSAGYGQPFASPITSVPFSVSARVKTTSTGTAQVAVGQNGQFTLGCDAAGHATASFCSGVSGGTLTSASTISSTAAIADGAWHTLELDMTPGGAILFVDGVAAGTSDQICCFLGGSPFGVRDAGGSRGIVPWTGEVCEVVVWPLAKHTTNYTLQGTPYTGMEGMTALYHLDGSGADGVSAYAAAIGERLVGTNGVRFFLGDADSVMYTVKPIGSTFPGAVPNQVTVAGSFTQVHDEPISPNLMLYVSGISGAPQYRWLTLPIVDQTMRNLETSPTTTSDATSTVIDTILITGQSGAAVNISGFVLARRTDTGDVCSFEVSAVIKRIDTSSATIDQQSITAFSPPPTMAACALTLGVFGTTITLSAVGLASTTIVWRPDLKTMVV